MKTPTALNFRGWRALICHHGDRNRDDLRGQLQRLGLRVTVRWPPQPISPDEADVVFFDADEGMDDMFGWPRGAPPMPLVALVGSEAPGRLEWMLSHAPSAYLVKPVRSTGVFAVLVVADHNFRRDRDLAEAVEAMKARLGARKLVFEALLIVMQRLSLSHEHAYALLRRRSMALRMTVEQLSALAVNDPSILVNDIADGGQRDRNGGRR